MHCPYNFPDDGKEYDILHYEDGRLHRDEKDGPAWVNANPYTIVEHYYWHGMEHRINGPAFLSWDRKTRDFQSERYVYYGYIHREPSEGPAVRNWHEGIVRHELWYYAAKQYRDPSEGPYSLLYNAAGEICERRGCPRKDLTKDRKLIASLPRPKDFPPRIESFPPRFAWALLISAMLAGVQAALA